MIRNYLKIAWRNIINKKFYTFLNISGLALAISCCIFIYLYASYNLSFDTYHKNADKIFRLVSEIQFDKTEYDKGTSYIENKTAIKEFPQVQSGAFLIADESFIINTDNKRFKEDKTIAFANTDWFKLFHHQLISGSFKQLDMPGNVIVRKQAARKYFGDTNPIGKIMLFNGKPIKVAGIIADGPYNTDMRWDMYVTFSSLAKLDSIYNDKYFLTQWGDYSSMHTSFVMLKKADDKTAVEKLLAEQSKKYFGANAKDFKFTLLPLAEAHFDTRYGGKVQKPLLWILVVIGILMICIAVINYINIIVAQQTTRSVEIGTRKVLGGTTGQIFMQFIMESLVTSVVAVMFSVIVVILLLPVANNWLFADNPVYVISYPGLVLYVIGLLILVTIGTGAYPAWLLSRISISRAYKKHLLNLPVGIGRKVLVLFQSTVTQGLVACTIVILMQVHLLKNTDIGFTRQKLITIPLGPVTASQKYQLNQSLKAMPEVQSASFCLNTPASNSHRGATVQFDTRVDWEKWPARYAIGDSAYCRTFGLQLIAGRNIRNQQPIPEFLINETMARMLLGSKYTTVIGKKLLAAETTGIIVGIVKDFNINSLATPIEPSVVLEDNALQTNLAIKLTSNETAATLYKLQKIYQRTLPSQVFSYQFVDEQIAQLYVKESIQQKLIVLAAIVAIIISSLGLLGLVSLIAMQRTKEIGIRKVLGASVKQLWLMLSNDFIWMVLLAFVIATPLTLLIMNKWLQGYAYRIVIHWWVFALTALIALFIAIVTVSFQSIKAAMANPVKSLRSE